MKKTFIILFTLFSFSSLLSADEIDGRLYLQKGKEKLDKKQFNEAITYLTKAKTSFPILADYVMFWLSDAYHEIDNHKESLNIIRDLLNEFPDTPLLKKARIREIKESQEINEKCTENLFRKYIKDYPQDNEIKYLYAIWLKNNNMTEKSKELFKEIYLSADILSDIASSEIDPSNLNIEDLLERSENLIRKMKYKKAEELLKEILLKDNGKLKKEILNKLGFTLFKQKKYIEASEIYKKAQDKYWELRSLYRAGLKDTVISEIENILNMNDSRMGSILIAIASDMRRDEKYDDALSLYQQITDKFPADKEDAIWGVGWTYYQKGEYGKAYEIFGNLYKKYEDIKYLYWQARSLEENGGNAEEIYKKIINKNNNFYTFLSILKNKDLKKVSNSDIGSPDKFDLKQIAKIDTKNSMNILRIDILLELGFKREALNEILYLSKKTNSLSDILYIIKKLNDIGEYKHSVKIATRLPFDNSLISFLYPSAYISLVEKVSSSSRIDPLFVISIIREESRFDPDAISPAGALGLMQLMPGTALKINKKIKNSHDILDVENNISAGVKYLSRLLQEFGSYTYALAAYNAGEDSVKRWLKNKRYKSIDEFIEDIPYTETKNYVKKVLSSYFIYKSINNEFLSQTNTIFEKL